MMRLLLLLVTSVAVTLAIEMGHVVQYNVIHMLHGNESLGVVVDNTTYPLKLRNRTLSTILYSGNAPTAHSGYHYVHIFPNNTVVKEAFKREPVTHNTVNEFFNRTWNNYTVPEFPQVYAPLPAIHRIPSDLHREGQIPTIHIVGNKTEFNQMHSNSTADLSVQGNVTYISLNETFFYTDVKVSLAGRSSTWLPKLSYNLKLHKDDRLYKYKRLKLRALDTDPSYIREQVAYDVVKSVGLASSEFSFVRIFLNDQPLGLFGIIDTFKGPWLSNVFANGTADYKNGYLYQGLFTSPEAGARGHISDLGYMDNLTAYADGQYKVKKKATGGDKGNWKPLQDLTKFIESAPTNSSDAVSTWQKHFDTDSVLRSMALEVLLGYADGYLSMADNYYVYQNPDTNNYFFISSDMDLTLGSTMMNIQNMWSGNYSRFPGLEKRPLMIKMLQVPQFNTQYNQLLTNITTMLVNPNKTNPRINALVDMIKEDVAWDKTLPRVGENLLSTALGGSSSQAAPQNGLGSAAASGGLPIELDTTTLQDFSTRMNASIPLMVAVNGPTGHPSLSGVKEWINNISQNITRFYKL